MAREKLSRDQRIRDPVHNLIKFAKGNADDEILWRLLQTRPLQRLRRIKQLGFSEFVYPGANHSRFSHALGAMQMARRMLDVLARNEIVSVKTKGYPSWRRATVCAALLHDVGHGPFSHVFEEVSHRLGISISHEDYTRQIIEETEIAEILKSYKVLDKTIFFFKTEAGSNIFSSIVSSQLDADRLDFLLRDRYYTGVQFSAIDLEWLFDCLQIKEIAADVDSPAVKQFCFVISPKGLSTLEDYLSAYSKMYSHVYFHKTTKAVQYMAEDLLVGIFSNKRYKMKIPDCNSLRRYFENPEKSLNNYLSLDDYTIMAFIKYVANAKFGNFSKLAQRILNRDLYKCFQPPKRPRDDPNAQKLSAFVNKLNKKKIIYHQDRLPPKGYKYYDFMHENFLGNILVFSEYDNDYRPVAELSPAVLPERNLIRFYFQNDDERNRAKSIAKSIWKNL